MKLHYNPEKRDEISNDRAKAKLDTNHIIGIASINEHAYTIIDQVSEEKRRIMHAVALHHECLVDLHVA